MRPGTFSRNLDTTTKEDRQGMKIYCSRYMTGGNGTMERPVPNLQNSKFLKHTWYSVAVLKLRILCPYSKIKNKCNPVLFLDSSFWCWNQYARQSKNLGKAIKADLKKNCEKHSNQSNKIIKAESWSMSLNRRARRITFSANTTKV